ncbi:OLC1v1023445C1 [Oldenlandia corymbosa var. corymbosa]|uniref:OLC1v1023445C1 n=1 Tax=Oldenlandia corymbosa var. corymbosa TaxID=529605 RepID=A0AAV1C0P4_OLDCO|nr:OLC1v1023445C1 [Oldenlandia corymbosa var. corymbosa]
MEDNEWRDPLLITDVCTQLEQHQELKFQDPLTQSYSSRNSMMVDHDEYSPNFSEDNSWRNGSLGDIHEENPGRPAGENVIDGRKMLGFSLTSPDLVICAGSPDIPRQSFADSPQFMKGASTVVSLENGINGSENETPKVAEPSSFPQGCKDGNVSPEADFELPPPPISEEMSPQHSTPVMSINVGSNDEIFSSRGVIFLEDKYFEGGDITRTESAVGNGEDIKLYQSARFGSFTYTFHDIRPGLYNVDLHFAEIVFTNGPSGMRVFDVFIQEQKVISSLDIYARVGGNRPLVVSNIKTKVEGEEGLSIRMEGLVGKPILCGISLKKDLSIGGGEGDLLTAMGISHLDQRESLKDFCPSSSDQEFGDLRIQFESQAKELQETKQALLSLRKENELKHQECQEAWRSLKELQNELMRKSMHVGSLAFAIEGQVKEKSRWFTTLRDMTRKLKLLKMEQIEIAEEATSFKSDMNDIVSLIQSKMEERSECYEDLKARFIKSSKERKELYNKVLELKGNIRVFCRCRPLNSAEVALGASMAIDFEAAEEGELTVFSNGMSKKTFKFDAVFSPQASQDDVFDDTAPVATSVLDGYNVCIFAYGQTGTGKTFTMEGTDDARGVNYRTLEALFHIIEERRSTFRYEISVSVLEVYNEQIRDLLVSDSGVGAKRLEIKQVGDGMHPVPGLFEAQVKTMKEAWEILRTGSNGRAVGSTSANEHSSRSHCLHCVMVKGENLLNGECTRSKLWLIDLAGSERIAKTEVQGERLRETQNINKSLSALGDVISALATKSPHIPFRNSKLTHLLQDSLGGDSKTLMFVQISPNENDLSETLCSLNFASRVRGIELGPAKKQVENNELLRCRQMVEKTKLDMKNKDFQIKKLEDTVQGLDIKMKEKDLKNKNLQEKIKELESQLLVERKLARQHVDNKIAEQHQEMKQQQDQHSLLIRPPLATKTNSYLRTVCDTKDHQANVPFPVLEYNSKHHSDGFTKQNELGMEKENKPAITDLHPLPRRTGRASMLPGPQQMKAQLPRRSSLIPLPSLRAASTLLPLAPVQPNMIEDDNPVESGFPLEPPTPWDSPKEQKMGAKRLTHIWRKSIQRKMQLKSPMQQPLRRVGINVGMEKVRVSIGSRGRMAQRVLTNARRAVKDTQQNPSKREKERGWNMGTATRVVS